MRRLLLGLLIAAFGAGSTGRADQASDQASAPGTPTAAPERQHVIGQMKVEAFGEKTRIQLWLNTPTYLAHGVVLSSATFGISPDASGGVMIESTRPVQVTGFTLDPNTGALQNAEGSVLAWDHGFKLTIPPDRVPQWYCCPRR